MTAAARMLFTLKHGGRSGSDPWKMEDYLNPDNALREAADLQSYRQAFAASTKDTLVFYCGTDWRASLVWFATELMGVQNAGVYDGGWLEWSSDSTRPVMIGDPDTIGDLDTIVSDLNRPTESNRT